MDYLHLLNDWTSPLIDPFNNPRIFTSYTALYMYTRSPIVLCCSCLTSSRPTTSMSRCRPSKKSVTTSPTWSAVGLAWESTSTRRTFVIHHELQRIMVMHHELRVSLWCIINWSVLQDITNTSTLHGHWHITRTHA